MDYIVKDNNLSVLVEQKKQDKKTLSVHYQFLLITDRVLFNKELTADPPTCDELPLLPESGSGNHFLLASSGGQRKARYQVLSTFQYLY